MSKVLYAMLEKNLKIDPGLQDIFKLLGLKDY